VAIPKDCNSQEVSTKRPPNWDKVDPSDTSSANPWKAWKIQPIFHSIKEGEGEEEKKVK